MKKHPEHQKEVGRVKKVVDGFRALIDMKQAEYNELGIDYDAVDLIMGTKYEDRVGFQGDLLEVYSTYGIYQVLFTPRMGKTPALLTENSGF